MQEREGGRRLTVEQFMELAIRFEMESAEFYRAMRGLVTERSAQELLFLLESQEKEHEQTLRRQKPPANPGLVITFTSELSLAMPMPREEPGFAEMLALAIARERKSADIYREAAATTAGEFRKLLEGLAAFEEQHERRLKDLRAARKG
jgi:rubrerythrin